MFFSRPKILAIALSVPLLIACEPSELAASATPASLVNTTSVQTIHYTPSQQFVGRIEAYKDVDIRAQVSGYLVARHFEDGQMVEQGQLLYEIDATRYQAAVAQAKAELAKAKSALANAELNWQRGERLLPQKNISQAEFDRLTAEKLSSEAQLEAAEALLSASLVDLKHTQVVAPFSGRVGQSEVSQGDLISSNSGRLTNLVSLDPIRASFSISERERLNMGLEKLNQLSQQPAAHVELLLADQHHYQQAGQLDFIDNRIDRQTGTIALSARFTNPQQQLLPGQYVEVKLSSQQQIAAQVIPRRAVQSDLEGEYVMLVNPQGKAERRNVSLGPLIEQGVIINQGLTGDEQVISAGLQRVRHGSVVHVVEPQA